MLRKVPPEHRFADTITPPSVGAVGARLFGIVARVISGLGLGRAGNRKAELTPTRAIEDGALTLGVLSDDTMRACIRVMPGVPHPITAARVDQVREPNLDVTDRVVGAVTLRALPDPTMEECVRVVPGQPHRVTISRQKVVAVSLAAMLANENACTAAEKAREML